MRFLTTMLWIVVVIAFVIFAINNWTPVRLALWGDLVADTFLPVPLIAAFLVGLLPYFLLHRASRWSMGRKLANAERALAQQTSLVAPAPTPVPEPTP